MFLKFKYEIILSLLHYICIILHYNYCIINSSVVESAMNCNLGQNIWRLFHFLEQFFFTASETELNYYHQKLSVRVASRVAERLKT